MQQQDSTNNVNKSMNLNPGSEGSTTRAIENQTSKVPSLGYFGLAVGSMVVSATLVAFKKKELGNFVGHWAPSLLVIGLYNKLVKIEKELLASRVN